VSFSDEELARAQRAADLYYTLMGAVEDCGASEALTELVMRLSDDHRKIRQMFGLDPSQIVRVIRPDDIYPLDTPVTLCLNCFPDQRKPWINRPSGGLDSDGGFSAVPV
jgi:hypothetical protein